MIKRYTLTALKRFSVLPFKINVDIIDLITCVTSNSGHIS